MQRHRVLIRGGYIISMDPEIGDLARGDVLIEDGTILAVGQDLGDVEAETVDASERIVLPGFVDTHRHTWQSLIRHVSTDWTLPQYFSGVRGVMGRLYTPEDMYAANLIGAVEALDSGITTLVDWSHNNNTPDHADAALDALVDSGIRAVFAYGNSNDEWLPVSDIPHSRDAERIRRERFPTEAGLVTMAMALRGPQFTTPEVTKHDFDLARELELPITVHVGDALWGLNGPVRELESIGRLGPDITYVHCNTIGDDEFDLIAGTQSAISIAPELEMTMGHGRLATLRAKQRGIPISISIDVCTSVGGDPFSAMRAVLAGSRYEVNLKAIEDREIIDTLPLYASDVLHYATMGGATAAWMKDRIGSLSPGKRGDVVLISTDTWSMTPLNYPAGAVVESGNPGLVDTVLVDGRIVKRNGRLEDHEYRDVRRLAEDARDRLARAAQVDDLSSWQPAPYEGQ